MVFNFSACGTRELIEAWMSRSGGSCGGCFLPACQLRLSMFRASCSSSLLKGYDEPETLRCSNPQVCPNGVDDRHQKLWNTWFYSWIGLLNALGETRQRISPRRIRREKKHISYYRRFTSRIFYSRLVFDWEALPSIITLSKHGTIGTFHFSAALSSQF